MSTARPSPAPSQAEMTVPSRPGPHGGKDPGQAPAPIPGHHPAVARELARAEELQVRLADLVTRFAGSMPFVYAHVAAFAVWMILVEGTPWPTLTLIVSLEAIFLSTFVMIGQNRQAAFQHLKADADFAAEQRELHANTELMRIIETHVREIHQRVAAEQAPR